MTFDVVNTSGGPVIWQAYVVNIDETNSYTGSLTYSVTVTVTGGGGGTPTQLPRQVYRPSTGYWYTLGAGGTWWGLPGDIPVPGDYDGNGVSDIAVFRPSNGYWYFQNPYSATWWGVSGDIPEPGDYDGDGKTDIAVYRPSNGYWFLQSPYSADWWGIAGDIPVSLPYIIRNAYYGAAAATGYSAVSAGFKDTCALRDGGQVICWGASFTGPVSYPVGETLLDVQVADWHYWGCGRRPDHTVRCWGSTSSSTAPPTGIPGDAFAQITTGESFVCGLVDADATMRCWGDMSQISSAQAGTFIQLSAAYGHACAIKTDHTLLCWGGTYISTHQGTPPSGQFLEVKTSSYSSCARKLDSTVTCWGRLSQPANPAQTYAQISLGQVHACGLRTDGGIDCWGDNAYGQSSPPAGTYLSVAAGAYHTCAVRNDNAVVCWGDNTYGQRTVP